MATATNNQQPQQQQLPIDSNGVCMLCKTKQNVESTLACATCTTPWHVTCLSVLPESMASVRSFECPDCTGDGLNGVAAVGNEDSELFAKIREIENDETISEKEKAVRRQRLMSGVVNEEEIEEEKDEKEIDVLAMLGESFKCSYCMELPERPVTTPCGHNFCLKCFEKWMKQGKQTCMKCRSSIPRKMAIQPRINSTLVAAIRVAKLATSKSSAVSENAYRFFHNQDRPEKAFISERAKKTGMANASSGRILVTLPKDHFGPIPAENDPVRNQGVLVGESWANRMDVRQWGIHYPPVAGICGKASYGAQSVVISGGYEDDEDNGEWFIYTGSGGRDLSGNKRTNKAQSFDQEFKDQNQALRVSCDRGYPVRVVRSEKDKRSSYAPEEGYRYDGVYRIEKCWRKAGIQGFKVCRYVFVRCDNEPAPWTSDEHGDRPRPLPHIPEFEEATDVFERAESPSWEYDEEEGCWKWKKPPPPSKEKVVNVNPEEIAIVRKVITKARSISAKENMLKGFSCLICKEVMNLPLTTPCGHNYCKSCLEHSFAGQSFEKERTCNNGRKLRSRKNVLTCPSCPTDISDFLQNPQVNRELMEVIERLKADLEKEKAVEKESNAVEEAEDNHERGLKRKSGPSEDEDKEGVKKPKTDGGETNDAEMKLSGETNSDPEEAQTSENGNISPSSPLQLRNSNVPAQCL